MKIADPTFCTFITEQVHQRQQRDRPPSWVAPELVKG